QQFVARPEPLPRDHLQARDAARERGAYARALQVQLRLAQRDERLVQVAPRPRRTLTLGTDLRVLDPVVEERVVPVHRFRRRDLRLRTLDLELVLRRIDLEEDRTLPDLRVLADRDPKELALDLGEERRLTI